jgi:transcriptional regulator with XRE-family HTH domain
LTDGIFEDREGAMGQQLKRLRAAAGLSQSQLARVAGVPVGTLKNWEQGRREPLLGAAARVARALKVSLDALADYGQKRRGLQPGDILAGAAGE